MIPLKVISHTFEAFNDTYVPAVLMSTKVNIPVY